MRTPLVLAALVFTLALGCAPAVEPPPEVDVEAVRASLMAADQAWYDAYSASDTPADVFAAKVTEDAYLLPPNAPVAQGREAIRSAIAALEAIPEFSVTWGPVAAEVGSGADLGYTLGTYEMTMAPEGSPITIVGKYLTVWKAQADGTWMVTADMFNADGPPSAGGE